MDPGQLNLFLSICRTRNFTRAAQEAHLSTSAVSRSIQRMEASLGYRLLYRDNRTVSLTPQGETFRRYAERSLALWHDLIEELAAGELTLTGTLTLFASVTASQSILPNVLSRFRLDYPEIHIQLETGYAVNAMERLGDGVDVVVAALPEDEDSRLVRRIITRIPIQTVAPMMGTSAGSEPDWSVVPLILPSSGQARENIDAWFRQRDIVPNIYAEVAGNEAILSLVALGCGIGFVPSLVVQDSPLASRVRVLEPGLAIQDFQVGFCTRRRHLENSSIIRAFWNSI